MHPRTKCTLRIALTFSIAGRSTGGRLTPSAVIHEMYPLLETPLVRILGHKVGQDDHLEVELDALPSRWKVHALAENLWQDWITVRDLDAGTSEMIGPHAPHHTLIVVPRGPYAGQRFANPQPLPLDPDTANFRDFGDCKYLASLGVFHTERTAFKQRKSAERAAQLKIEGAYEWLGLDRKREENRVATQIIPECPDGVWPRSTGLFGARMAALDEHVLAHAERLGYCS